MPLIIRLATAADQGPIEKLVIDSFAPITWQKNLDGTFGPLNGRDWAQRWSDRLKRIFTNQTVLVGEFDGRPAAMSSVTIDQNSALGFIDVLCVAAGYQGRGLGREMLRGTVDHLKSLGCQYVNLECLTTNDVGNALYASEGFQEVARHIRWFKKI